MSYHTGAPTGLGSFHRKHGKSVWAEAGFEIIESNGGRYYLLKGDLELSEIISGKRGFDKQHSSDPHKWIEQVKKKDLKKAEGIKKKAQEAIETADFIISIWK